MHVVGWSQRWTLFVPYGSVNTKGDSLWGASCPDAAMVCVKSASPARPGPAQDSSNEISCHSEPVFFAPLPRRLSTPPPHCGPLSTGLVSDSGAGVGVEMPGGGVKPVSVHVRVKQHFSTIRFLSLS